MNNTPPPPDSPDSRQLLIANIAAAQATFAGLASLSEPLSRAAELVRVTLTSGQKLLCCGNGGSASEGGHLAAEIVGRYVKDRPGFPAIDLTADHGLITALINDYPPEMLFARQVRALGKPGDLLIVFTTSGKSPNIVKALQEAKALGLQSIAFLGRDGGACKGLADVDLIVPSPTTARIQEAHQLLLHTICEAVDPFLCKPEK